MFKHIRDVVSIPQFRSRLLLTLVLLAAYRLGFSMPLPFVNQAELAESWHRQGGSGVAQVVSMRSLFLASNIGVTVVFAVILAVVWCVPDWSKVLRSSQVHV